MPEIRYRYALDPENNLVDIRELDADSPRGTGDYRCLSCGRSLIPVLGQKRRRHFRHSVKLNFNCSLETYLHKLGKESFYIAYNTRLVQKLPFLIEFKMSRTCTYHAADFLVDCHLKDTNVKFDLTKYFTQIFLEKRETSFIPDLLLTNDRGDKLFVEIAINHKVNREKINSGNRIIEIELITEDDTDTILSYHLKESEKIRFFNFKRQQEGNLCDGNCFNGISPYSSCPIRYHLFIIYRDGKSILAFDKDADYVDKLDRPSSPIAFWEFIPNVPRPQRYKFYLYKIVEAYCNKIAIKNCFLCRYHGTNHSGEEAIYCKFLKKRGNSNMAAGCSYYRPDEKVFPNVTIEKISSMYDRFLEW